MVQHFHSFAPVAFTRNTWVKSFQVAHTGLGHCPDNQGNQGKAMTYQGKSGQWLSCPFGMAPLAFPQCSFLAWGLWGSGRPPTTLHTLGLVIFTKRTWVLKSHTSDTWPCDLYKRHLDSKVSWHSMVLPRMGAPLPRGPTTPLTFPQCHFQHGAFGFQVDLPNVHHVWVQGSLPLWLGLAPTGFYLLNVTQVLFLLRVCVCFFQTNMGLLGLRGQPCLAWGCLWCVVLPGGTGETT